MSMASSYSQCIPQLSYFSTAAAASFPPHSHFILTGLGKNRSLTVSCCKNSDYNYQSLCDWIGEQAPTKTTRRQLLLQPLFAALSFPAFLTNSFALADSDLQEEDFRFYSDDVNKFEILIPRDWQVGSGEGNGIKSLIAFYPQEASTSNVSIVITGLGADFTRLESFGKVDAFAENLVSGLDRSWQRPPGVAAKLLDCKAANGLYYIEYTLQNPGETRRHLFSVLGIANNGWYNRLYTLTGQFVEEEASTYGSKIEKVVASFRFI